MKPIKKTLVLVLSAALLALCGICLVACGGTQTSSTAGSAGTQAPAKCSTLVVYYSATGNTAAIAQEIIDMTGADSFIIEPVEGYTSADLDYNDANSRVSKEHDDPTLRDIALVQDTPANWDDYDTVILGYPIWWGEAAWPVDSFVKANDFSGKSVIPFCTSASSGMGDSARQLEQMAGSGTWLGGMRFPAAVSEDEVRQWVDDLGLETQDLQ